VATPAALRAVTVTCGVADQAKGWPMKVAALPGAMHATLAVASWPLLLSTAV
jgi:hypothetical protein